MSGWYADCEHLKAALTAAQSERHLRQTVDGEVGWVTYERNVMHDEVNRLRARRGRGPVTVESICRAEQLACGHIDYTTKYAIGCADVVWAEASA